MSDGEITITSGEARALLAAAVPTLKTGVRGGNAGGAYFRDLMGGCRKLMALIGIPAETMASSIEEDGDEGRRLAALFREEPADV